VDLPETKILYLIQLPPPVHGVSTINSIIYHSPTINSGINKLLLEVKFSDTLSELRKTSFSKLMKFCSLAGKLRKLLRKESPDLVYFSVILVGKGFWRDLLLIRVIKRTGTTPVYHIHNRGIGRNAKRPLYRILYRYIFSNAIVIHLSVKLLEQEVIPFKGANCRTYAVPNGIPAVNPPAAINPELKGRKQIKLIFLSNLFNEKGIFDLLKIMSAIKDIRSDIRLRISGELLRKNIGKRLRGSIEEAGLETTVELTGPLYAEAKDEVLRDSDIFIFPSYFKMECFPLVILEAMSHGLPIIASGIGAMPEILEDGKEGILLKERDIDGFANSILKLAANDELRKKMGSAARNKFFDHYTSSHLEDSIRNVFETCISEFK
jgi:glycosyltransferase involved in cell wall biosynthesis